MRKQMLQRAGTVFVLTIASICSMAYGPPELAMLVFGVTLISYAVLLYRFNAQYLGPEWELIMQSKEVDTVLARYYVERNRKPDEVPELDAAKAWSEYGLYQTRALLHQSLKLVCNDDQIVALCRPVWLLAWIHARMDVLKTVKKLKQSFSVEIGKINARWESRCTEIEAENKKLKKYLEEKDGYISELRLQIPPKQKNPLTASQEEFWMQNEKTVEELMEEKGWIPKPEDGPLTFTTTAERNAAIVEFCKTNKAADAAERFGVTENNVRQIVHKAKKQKEAS